MAALIRPARGGQSPRLRNFVPGASMMKRPLMNPSFLDEVQPQARRGPRPWRRCLTLILRLVKLLFTDVFRRKAALREEVGTPFARFMRGLLYRLMLVPTLLAVLIGVLVVTA